MLEAEMNFFVEGILVPLISGKINMVPSFKETLKI